MDESLQDADGNRTFPKRLLRWDALDTLILSVNYLQGSLPSPEDDPDFPKWTRAEVDACDTLPADTFELAALIRSGNYTLIEPPAAERPEFFWWITDTRPSCSAYRSHMAGQSSGLPSSTRSTSKSENVWARILPTHWGR